MDIGFVQIGNAQALRVQLDAQRSEAQAPRDTSRVAEPPRSGLEEPFNLRGVEASVVRAQLGNVPVPGGKTDGSSPEAQSEPGTDATPLTEPDAKPGSATAANELSEDEQAVVAELSARDREVRNHEEAHARVGGQYAGNPSYSFQEGPDGKQYAIGGEVPIDVSPVPDDPEATIDKMEVVKAAALAPAEPSGQDRRVAALADAQRQQAIADLAELRRQTEPVAEPSLDIAA